jgi:hypothetical protein
VFVVDKTTLEQESRDLVDPVICRCRKYQQLACQEGASVAIFPLNISMVHSSKLTFIVNGNNLTDVGFTPGETIYFGSLKFTANCFSNLSLSPEGNDSGAVFVGMVHNKSSSLHTILEESSDEGDTTSDRGGALDSPALEGATW